MTDLYAVIGNPIAHSKSPLIHSTFAARTDQNMSYVTLLAPIDGFNHTVDAFRAGGGRGLNVTMPFKMEAFGYASEIGERAKLAGAVNALKFEGGHVMAENFDGDGLVVDVERNHEFSLRGRKVLLLGAGGAARGALKPILDRAPNDVVIANTTRAKADDLARRFAAHGPVRVVDYADLGGEAPFDLVLNATSASMTNVPPPVPAGAFAIGGFAYDLAYGRGLTPFLRLAANAGVAHLADGVGMLVEQAADAFNWWRGTRPATKAMIAKLTVPLV